jgi:phosphomannomutase/phosphoglucomutase
MKIAVDCGNGVPGAFAPELYRRLGCEVTELYCEVDGTFPNHHPDPSVPKNLEDLIRALQSTDAEIGFAFDGDGDRLGVVTKNGGVIYPDRQLMLFAQDVLARNPRNRDLRCQINASPQALDRASRRPAFAVEDRPLDKAKMAETGALLAGEMSEVLQTLVASTTRSTPERGCWRF